MEKICELIKGVIPGNSTWEQWVTVLNLLEEFILESVFLRSDAVLPLFWATKTMFWRVILPRSWLIEFSFKVVSSKRSLNQGAATDNPKHLILCINVFSFPSPVSILTNQWNLPEFLKRKGTTSSLSEQSRITLY